ncbi:YchJ family protein [Runella sp. SP2]|uniref:YchJ family protein n=1 Tax=Runella sp. SP2 TaxID=2268026 RepID=UPI000F07AD1F|nr:YchJ family protein [Runella sp. SP2]AYQ31525.1 YchJ family protein [Runella sp. SP2]
MTSTCFCGSTLPFDECCGNIISGKRTAVTALELMKSRYSAYCVVAGDYLIATTHSSKRAQFDKASIEQWAKESQWKGLKIISTAKGSALDSQGEVAFQALYIDESKKSRVHYEHSLFVKEHNQWFYLSGKTIAINRNDDCPCGSGKKYKKCCGA